MPQVRVLYRPFKIRWLFNRDVVQCQRNRQGNRGETPDASSRQKGTSLYIRRRDLATGTAGPLRPQCANTGTPGVPRDLRHRLARRSRGDALFLQRLTRYSMVGPCRKLRPLRCTAPAFSFLLAKGGRIHSAVPKTAFAARRLTIIAFLSFFW